MPEQIFTIVGIGELLWDLLPTGRQLGGAPGNFAYITSLLGDRGVPASRVGNDELGQEVLGKLSTLGLPTEYLQFDPAHGTGTVKVQIDGSGQPCYEIVQGVAWDFLEWTSQWRMLAEKADAICFGSLAQRSTRSRETIRAFLRASRPGTMKVFDVNLRQSFYNAEVLASAFAVADIAKLNHEELPHVMRLLGLSYDGDVSSVERLRETQRLKLVCVTRGEHGSVLADESGTDAHPGFEIQVADTVGSGDAFTAALVNRYLRRGSLADMNDMANRAGAWVASKVGAMPAPGDVRIEEVLAEIG
jgi:fructokinase